MKAYVFTLPSLQRETYDKLRRMVQEQQINQHGLITIAIHLLDDVLSGKTPDIQRIQAETGIKRLDSGKTS